MKKFFLISLTLLALGSLTVAAQLIDPGARTRPAAKSESVQYLFPEQITAPANKPAVVALHFRVAQGMHINSHTPGDEFLIPSVFSIPENTGVRLQSVSYPPGTLLTLPADPKTRLNVYTGEFILEARIVATPGNHMVEAKFHYQACDNNQCMPPKTIPVAIDVIGK